MIKKTITLTIWILSVCLAYAQESPKEQGLLSITPELVKGQHEFLSSDWTEGRETATRGAYLAADYIASVYKIFGLKPAGDYEWTDVSYEQRQQGIRSEKYRTFFQNFELISACPIDKHSLAVVSKNGTSSEKMFFNYKTDFSFSSYSTAGVQFEAPVVFVGYGFTNEDENYDDFKGIDVEGKVILRISGYPGIDDTASPGYKKFKPTGRYANYYLRRDKDRVAREKGAIAVIDIPTSDYTPDSWIKNKELRYNLPYYEGDKKLKSMYECSLRLPEDTLDKELIRLYVTKRVSNYLMDGQGIDLEAYKEKAANKFKPGGKALKGKSILFSSKASTELVQARNVVGVIEGKKKNEIIVLGAHYDHLGSYDGYIWNGADDNASGTVAVMTLAHAMMESGVQPEKTIVFACWTGEEKGLLGSRYFVDNPYGDTLDHIVLNLNFDMISRNSSKDTTGKQAFMSFFKSYPILKETGEKNLKEYGIDLEFKFWPSKGGRGGSDHAPFSMKGIPFCFYMAGMHKDYHKPTDHISDTNYDKMINVIKLAYLNLWDLANTDWKEGDPE